MKLHTIILIIVAGFALLVLTEALFIVDMTEQALITQFGRPVTDPITEPGLHIKLPFMQKVHVFEKRILEWQGQSNEILTKDKKYIWVDIFARWRIVDPLQFFTKVRTEERAHGRLDDIVDPATRNLISSHDLIEVVRTSNRKMEFTEEEIKLSVEASIDSVAEGREAITNQILDQAKSKMMEYGIELIDVKIRRLNYTEDVRKAVYDRMITERTRIAEKFRSEGQGVKAEIEGQMEKKLKEIKSEAYRTAQQLMGKADAEAIKIYADAYNRDPEFYSFIKTLETYRETIKDDDWLILTTDSDYFKYLKEIGSR
ncbi:protease modulator HflC [candidate division KSB1 bacterium]|nr:protease modulator HflC [candidate division KSB1 bacterium]